MEEMSYLTNIISSILIGASYKFIYMFVGKTIGGIKWIVSLF